MWSYLYAQFQDLINVPRILHRSFNVNHDCFFIFSILLSFLLLFYSFLEVLTKSVKIRIGILIS